jgi:hypothetical protein
MTHDAAGSNEKFAGILFDATYEAHKPQPLRPHTHYVYPQGRTELLRWLTNQPAYLPRPLGRITKHGQAPRPQPFRGTGTRRHRQARSHRVAELVLDDG